jgi:proprotein convertase subtilisin/kexin type 5
VAQCVEGEYLSSGVCSACDTNCLTCLMYGSTSFTIGNGTYCLTCATSKSLFGSSCVDACPSGYYSSVSVCELCMSNCLNCTASNSCSACQSGFSLYSNSCLYTCPASTVSVTNASTLQASCLACPSNCLSCSSLAAPQCNNCLNGFYLYNGGCLSNCSSVSLYVSYQMTCAVCQCLTCSTFAFNCTACANPYNLYNSQCILSCPNGYYASSNICLPCTVNCLSCTSSSQCQYCFIPYALYTVNATTSTCNLICPNGTITTIDTVSFKYVCESCGGFCQTCQTSITYCLSCISGYILNNNTCVSTCPVGTWQIAGICKICSPACQACSASNPYNCSQCASNYFYSNYSCNSSCPAGTYADISTLICQSCSIVCSTCLNSTNCTSCINGYFLYNSFCFNNCTTISSLYYSYNGSCLICQPQCSTCLTTPF